MTLTKPVLTRRANEENKKKESRLHVGLVFCPSVIVHRAAAFFLNNADYSHRSNAMHPSDAVFGASRSLMCVLLFALLAVTAGCGGSLGKVTGRVTFQDQPAEGVQMVFRSQVKPEVICRALTLADGSYQLDYGIWEGIPPGPCDIELTHQTLPNGQPAPGGEEGAALRAAGKVKTHQVSFTRDIVAGSNEIDLEITAGEPISPAAE